MDIWHLCVAFCRCQRKIFFELFSKTILKFEGHKQEMFESQSKL